MPHATCSMQIIRLKQSIHKIHSHMHRINSSQMRKLWRISAAMLYFYVACKMLIMPIHTYAYSLVIHINSDKCIQNNSYTTKVKRFSLHLLHFTLHCELTNRYFGCVRKRRSIYYLYTWYIHITHTYVSFFPHSLRTRYAIDIMRTLHVSEAKSIK